MQPITLRTILGIALSLCLLCACGCAKRGTAHNAPSPAPEQPVQIITITQDETTPSDSAEHSGIYCVDATTDESADGAYASLTPNENVVLVENGGTLHMTGSDINKLGDATSAISSGQNAAIAATTGGQCALESCVITSNATGGFGLYVSGKDTLLTATDCVIATSSASSAGLCAPDGGTMRVSGGSIAIEDGASPMLLAGGDAAVTLQNVSLSIAGGEMIRIPAGTLRLVLIGQTLTGGVSIQDDALLLLTLTQNSVFTGTFGDKLPATAGVFLDESSAWNLTSDTQVRAFVNADATHQNIVSNGFSIHYDSNIEENAPLQAQTYPLPGGGYLAPII